MDQIVSGQTGMVPQESRKMVTAQFVGVTVFIDIFSCFSYKHMMSSLDGPQTLDAKLSFERLALAYGVVVRSY